MPVPIVRLGPQMNTQQLVSALNQNFQNLERMGQTQIFRDENGVNQIIIGKLPDGTYGLVISKPGIDVLSLFS